MRLPSFFIIGAMKSATTTLQVQLAAQTGIFMCEPKEPNFFSDDPIYAQGIEWYGGLFADAKQGDLLGEASTHYSKMPELPDALPRLLEAVPDPLCVYVMRHPVERLVSHYMHAWSENETAADIDSAVRELGRLTDYSRYAYQLEPWLKALGPGRVLPVFMEGIKSDPSGVLDRVARFIGYEGEATWKDDVGAQNVSSQRIRKFPGYSMLVDSAPAAWVRRTFVPQALRDRVKSKLQMQTRPELSEASLAHLTNVFDADLAILGDWLGTELSCANYKEKARQPQNWRPDLVFD